MPTPPLSEAKIKAIQEELAAGELTQEQIALKLGVGHGTVSKVKNNNVKPRIEPVERKPDEAIATIASFRPGQYLLFPDLHFPEVHWGTWYAGLDFLDRNRVSGVTFTGDQLDLAEISHWNRDRPMLRGRGALRSNLDEFNALLDEVDKRLTPDAEKVWHRGNHERFIQDFYEANPELEGMLDLEEHLKLADRGYRVVKLGGTSHIGELTVLHGDSVGSAKYVANKLVESHCTNVVMGHVHTASSFTKISASNASKKWMGWTLPTMGTTNPAFARNRPNSHMNGFGIVEVVPSGQFNLYTVITDSLTGDFAYGGQVYRGGKGKRI
jgi:hypothetical protein